MLKNNLQCAQMLFRELGRTSEIIIFYLFFYIQTKVIPFPYSFLTQRTVMRLGFHINFIMEEEIYPESAAGTIRNPRPLFPPP